MPRKSCLKTTPTLTPDVSEEPSTPSGSKCGRGSPGPPPPGRERMGMQKRVSSYEEEGLEDMYKADEWGRSAAPVMPRLSAVLCMQDDDTASVVPDPVGGGSPVSPSLLNAGRCQWLTPCRSTRAQTAVPVSLQDVNIHRCHDGGLTFSSRRE
ncbi:hypothetical protein AcV5_005183 [Taiwanofungus camphoratus]|nr:hypothetical protein AcV5_005474 [Antrodia cinnamomea]KAI0937235.1 hypothetical protein AcV5_005183 [Antrodia cinnamomea]